MTLAPFFDLRVCKYVHVSLGERQTREGLVRQGNVAVGENCVAAMKFEISGFTTPGARLLHTFFAQVGPRPLSFFSGGLQSQGGPL